MKKTKKNATKESSVMNLRCSVCGRETPHYVNAKGEVKCAICQTTAKTVKVKIPKEVVFEMDEDLDNALNPTPNEEPEAPTEDETITDFEGDLDEELSEDELPII